jgi:hypothetical protein
VQTVPAEIKLPFARVWFFLTLLWLAGLPLNAQAQESGVVPVEEKSILERGVDLQQRIRENLFIRVETDKKRCYAGEGLRVTYKLYTRLKAHSQIIRRPSWSGCSVVDMVEHYDGAPELAFLDGSAYYVHLIRQAHLFPLQPGPLTLDAAEVESTLYFSLGKDAQPGAFPGIRKETGETNKYVYTKTITSHPVSIEVRALPDGAMEGFTGAIGNFTLRASAVTPIAERGGLYQIRLTVTGMGNFPLLVSPRIPPVNAVNLPVPDVQEWLEKKTFPLKGEKSFTYTLTVPNQDTLVFPAVSWVYFDPQKGVYNKVSSNALVIPIVASSAATVSPQDAVPHPLRLSFYKFIAFGVLLSILLLWALYRKRYNSRYNRKEQSVLQRESVTKATVEGEPLFSKPRQYLEQGEALLFYQELQRSLLQRVSDRAGWPASSWDKRMFRLWLEKREMGREAIERWMKLLGDLDSELYSGGNGDGSAMRHYWMEAQILVESLDEMAAKENDQSQNR